MRQRALIRARRVRHALARGPYIVLMVERDNAQVVHRDFGGLLQHALDRRISITCEVGTGEDMVRIGADELQQVLVNLALNARDAMSEGGRLRLRSARCDLADEAGRLGLEPGRYVELTVADSGHGIAAEHLERIFDPFFTTRPVGQDRKSTRLNSSHRT